MRIGIITMPLVNNYGAILQAFALKTVLERMGHNVTFVECDRKMHLSPLKALLVYPYRIFKRYILRDKYTIINYEHNNNENIDKDIAISKQITPFIQNNFKIRTIRHFKDLNEEIFEAYIVGSDQVWRHFYSRTIIGSTPATYLDFTQGWHVKRISYAASFGTTWWEMDDRLTNLCGKLLAKFDAVSVREKDGVEMCNKYLGYFKAIQVLDPTMLLKKEDYTNLFIENTSISPGNLLCYLLDSNLKKEKFVEQVASQLNLKPFSVNELVKTTDGLAKVSVETWLRGFYDAKYVIADSFHACVFAILFNKPFAVILNEDRGLSRFYSLLSMFGLEDRIIDEKSEYALPQTKCQPNMKMLDYMKHVSYEFLEQALSENNCKNKK